MNLTDKNITCLLSPYDCVTSIIKRMLSPKCLLKHIASVLGHESASEIAVDQLKNMVATM